MSEKSIDGASVVLGLEDHPEYTFIVLKSDCFSADGPEGEELLRTLGERSNDCDYALLRSGVRYHGVPYDSPNAPSDRFAALPAKDFPVEGDRIPALDRVTLKTLYAWLEGDEDGPLLDLGTPPEFLELHRFSKFSGFTRYERATVRCGTLRLEAIRTDWHLEGGEYISRPAPPARACTSEGAGAAEPAVAAEEVARTSAAPEQAVPVAVEGASAPPVPPMVQDVSKAMDFGGAASETRDLVLGGVCLLVGLGAGLMLRRRPGSGA
ncbi:MAG TPA: hypothetical protein VIK91_07710 [Nannocystis sp.]